jgi:DNA-binding LacI/PurR family transcriptional regulator
MVIMKDVAKYANTSIFTVSSVINGKKSVSPQLRKRVLSAIKELDYVPDSIAASLKRKRSYLVGLIISDIEDNFFPQVIKGIEETLDKAGISILLSNTMNDPEKELNYLKIMMQKKVDGLIIFPSITDKEKYNILLKKQIPAVFIDREIESLKISAVLFDDYKAAFNATDYLIKNGHTKIGIIVYGTSISTGKDRFNGYKDALLKNNIPINKQIIKIINSYKQEDSFNATKELLCLGKEKPTALFTTNDFMFNGALKAINEKDLKIPDDISILTFNDMDYYKYLKTSITAVSLPTFKIGKSASELLLKIIKSSDYYKKIIIKTELIIRDSVKNIIN